MFPSSPAGRPLTTLAGDAGSSQGRRRNLRRDRLREDLEEWLPAHQDRKPPLRWTPLSITAQRSPHTVAAKAIANTATAIATTRISPHGRDSAKAIRTSIPIAWAIGDMAFIMAAPFLPFVVKPPLARKLNGGWIKAKSSLHDIITRLHPYLSNDAIKHGGIRVGPVC